MIAKTTHVLVKTYSLQVSHPQQIDMLNHIVQRNNGTLNEHELAVKFLAEFAGTIQQDHPQAIREIEKYIRMSKGAYNRGLAHIKEPQNELFFIAKQRFGIDANTIEAA